MERVLPTKAQIARRIRKVATWVGGALFGCGVALSLSIILIGPGVALLILGAMVLAAGWGASFLTSLVISYRQMRCPYCQQVSAVLPLGRTFQCDGCARRLATAEATAVSVAALTPGEPEAYSTVRRILILFTGLAYIAFFIEVYLGHYPWIWNFRHTFSLSWTLVPVVFSPIGLVVAMITAARFSPGAVRVYNVVMVSSIVVGMVGTYFHIVARVGAVASLFALERWLGNPPALAPFAFALPGLMGLVATYGLEWVKVEKRGLAPSATTPEEEAVAPMAGSGLGASN